MKFKKLITWMLIFLMLFNFLTGTISCKATDEEESKEANEEMEFIRGATDVLLKGVDGLIGVLTWTTRVKWLLIPYAVQQLTSLVAYSEGFTDGWQFAAVTPAHILFNKINLTDINIFEMNPSGGKAIKTIRSNIRKWYYAMFTLAAIILLCILVYIGIRMAISTVAEKKAVYKNWLMNWFVSLILLFMLHFIIRGTIYLNGQLVKIFEKAEVSEMSYSIANFVTVTGKLIIKTMNPFATVGWAALCVYICLVILTIMFLIMYIKRMLTISFLIIIAPLITITYSIDKLGDNKSQALDTWLKEFIYGILIQPFHCILYLVFVSQAIDLCSTGTLASMLLAVMMMFFIMKAEGIVRKIFGFEKASSAATGAMAGAALMSGINGIKSMVGKAQKVGAPVTKAKDRSGGNSGGSGGSGGSGNSGGSGASRTNGTRNKNTPNVTLRNNKRENKKKGKIQQAIESASNSIKGSKIGQVVKQASDTVKDTGVAKLYNKAKTIEGKYIDNNTAKATLIGALAGGMTQQGAVAGATVGYGIGKITQKKREDRRNIKEGTEAVKNAYCNYQESSSLSDEKMTAYTNELLNDPEKLDDMQQIDGESIEKWKERTKRSTETDSQWNDRMIYAKSLYALQNSYQKSGVDGDDANDKIADTIRKLQQSSVDPYREPIPDPWEDQNMDVSD